MKKIFLGAFLMLAAAFVGAQDKSLVETLVKNGTLTEDQARKLIKESVVVTPSNSSTKVLTIGGGVQAWYSWGKNSVKSPSGVNGSADTNGFELRYVKVGLSAEILGGWLIDVVTDFGSEGVKRNYLDKVVISKKFDWDYLPGRFDIGMKKVKMGYEQNIDDFELPTIERSVATWFFTRPNAYSDKVMKNFGSRAIGLFWDGDVACVKGLTYGLALVGGNSYEGSSAYLANYEGNNDLTVYANVAYHQEGFFKDRPVSWDAGLNFGFAKGGFVRNGAGSTQVWGFNPFVAVHYSNFSFMAEYFIQGVEDGKFNSARDALPQGVNVILSYKFDTSEIGQIEPIFRFSWISTDSMGFNPVTMGGFSTPGDVYNLYDKAQTFYLGVNWYVIPAVKVAFGYEWGEYRGAVGNTDGQLPLASRAMSNAFKASLQVLF